VLVPEGGSSCDGTELGSLAAGKVGAGIGAGAIALDGGCLGSSGISDPGAM
jgi:hypothetical protein